MKLKTLTIKNIASIEDAVIDFTCDQLANAGMFLICGPTGAGKSTILDAICLALFNTTPRINNSSGELIDIPIDESKKKEKINDVLHLVRKNALCASVTLTFEGKDNEDYKACWSVYRQGLYRNGKEVTTHRDDPLEDKLKRSFKKEWSISDSKGTVFEKDVENKIIEIIGMDFNQFCKTTMLAQGDFTKFLSCKADDKAAILEKLVGVTQFTKVGMAINQLTCDKKNEMELVERQLESETFLSDEERDERCRQIDSLKEEINTLKKSQKVTEAKISWINERNKATEEVNKAQTDYQNASVALASEEVIRRQKILDLWYLSVDVRQSLKSRDCAHKDRLNQQNKSLALYQIFEELLKGLKAMREDRESIIAENKLLNAYLDEHKPYEAMYEKSNVIISNNDTINQQLKYISDNTPKLQEYENLLNEHNGKLQEKICLKDKISAEIADLRAMVQSNRQDVLQYHPDSIDAEKSELHLRKNLITEIEYLMSNISETTTDCEHKAKKVEATKMAIASLEKQRLSADEQLQIAVKNYDKSKAIYEKTKASISDHAKVLRAKLTVGDSCPVCGSRINQILSEEGFIEALKPLEDKYRDDESKVFAANKAYERILADINATNKTLTSDVAELDKAKSRYAKYDADLRAKASKLNLDYDNLSLSLSNIKVIEEKKAEDLARRQASIKDLNDKYDTLNNKINESINHQTKVIDREIADIQKSIEDIIKKKSNIEGAINNANRNIDSLRQSLTSLIDPNWHPRHQDTYFEELNASAQKYSLTKNMHSDNLRKIDTLEQNLDVIQAAVEDIVDRFPLWKQVSVDTPVRIVNLTNRWNQLRGDCVTLHTAMQATESVLDKSEKDIEIFSNEHPDIDMNDVIKILDIPNDRMMNIRNYINNLNDEKSRTESVLQSKVKALEKYSVSPLSDEDTLESLTELGNTNIQIQHERSQAIGRIESELVNDDKLRAKMGQLKISLDKLRAEYAEWKQLDNYLGSKDGKKFRNVAQSFILKDLLDKANAYLENITGRYRLFCNPGTLTIMMYDDYQGGVVRPTNTLSGGESFIISLALALGLSSMQSSGFEVDTLFIDEGFGTLSPELLDPVITTLRRLNEKYQRRVGIISHVEALKSRIPVTVEVSRQGKSRSKVQIISTPGL